MPQFQLRPLKFQLERQPALVSNETVSSRCPVNGRPGKAVQKQTLKAMLNVSLKEIRSEADYLFCPDRDCPVVYFSSDGTQTLTQTLTSDQLRERVYQKAADEPAVLVCYCFQHTLGSIQTASPE